MVAAAKDRDARLSSNLESKMQEMVERSNEKSDGVKVAVGDNVFLKTNVRNRLSYELGPKFESPFRVVEIKKGIDLLHMNPRSREQHSSIRG